MKANYSTDALRVSPNTTDDFSYKKHRRRMTATSTATTNSVAIDVHPLPFPYHNDNTFLPTVETGRTRFDSESAQSLYNQQSTGPAHTHYQQHLYSRQSSGAPSRINGSYHRHRRESRASHYSAFTDITDTTVSTTTTVNANSTLQDGTQQNGRLHRFQTTKRQLSKLISRNRFNTNSSNTQRSLPTLLTRKRTCPSPLGGGGGGGATPMAGQRSDSRKTHNIWNGALHELRWRPSSALISLRLLSRKTNSSSTAIVITSTFSTEKPYSYPLSRKNALWYKRNNNSNNSNNVAAQL